MKRAAAFALACILTLALLACTAKPAETKEMPAAEESTGASFATESAPQQEAEAPAEQSNTFRAVAYRAGDVTFGEDYLKESGMDQTWLTLNDDHTGSLTLMGESFDIGWTEDGHITQSGLNMYTFTYTDENTIELVMYETISYTLVRDGSAPAVTAEAVTTEAPAEQPEQPTEAPVVTEAPTAAPAQASGNGAPYGDSDGVITHDQLCALYWWMKQADDFAWQMTFDDISSAVGKLGMDNQKTDGTRASANWWDENKKSITVTFQVDDDGVYRTAGFVTTLTSSEYENADISALPRIGPFALAGSSPVQESVIAAKIGFSGPSVNITAQVPTVNWYAIERSGKARYACSAREADASYGHTYIEVEVKESEEKINFYQDSFENYVEIDPRTIGGIEMVGRTYKNIGMDWIEYYGELQEGVWISVKLTNLKLTPGTEAAAIVESLTFRVAE